MLIGSEHLINQACDGSDVRVIAERGVYIEGLYFTLSYNRLGALLLTVLLVVLGIVR